MFRNQSNPFVRIGLSLLLIGVLLLAFNLFNTWRTVQEYSTFNFWDVFWYTEGSNGRNTARITVQVWGPVILIPLGALLLAIAALRGGANKNGQATAAQMAASEYGGPQAGKPRHNNVQAWDAQFGQPGQAAPQPDAPQHGGSQAQYGQQAPQYGQQPQYGKAAAAPQYGQAAGQDARGTDAPAAPQYGQQSPDASGDAAQK